MKTFGIKDLCERFAVGEHTVLAWIRRGELRALNVGRKPDGRPKWRVTAEALAAFEAARTPTPPQPRVRRKRRPADIVEFYK
jgi:excisionase family DNA binding protein